EAQGLVGSAEYRRKVVADDYTRLLRRAAGPQEIDLWAAALQRGATQPQVLAALAGSDEYFRQAGGTNAGFLDRLYLDLLGRNRDTGSQPFLDALNQNRASREQVATALLSSTEYRQGLVQALYTSLLGRSASDAEVGVWVAALQGGARQEQVAAAIA